jgi:hypothetical protein
MSTKNLLRMTSPLRDDFTIPFHDFGDPERPPALALVAGLHGDELNGIFVLSRLADFLRGVVAGERPDLRLNERIVVVPAVNLLGVNTKNRRWPFDGTDINRMFPGYDRGETTQRIAYRVIELTLAARHRIDIHSSNTDFEELPQVRLFEASDRERELAKLFGLPAIIERAATPVFTSTLGYAWRYYEGETFVLQAGRAGTIQPHHCEQLFHGLLGFLGRTGVVTGVEISDVDDDVHLFPPNHTMPVISDGAGFFVSRLAVGRWIQAGDPIGQVYDPFDGSLKREIKAPVAGLLSGLRRQPLLVQGDLVARIQTRHPLENIVEPHLAAQGQ